MASDQATRKMDPSAALLYGVSLGLLLVYLIANVLAKVYHPIPPLLRIILPVLACLSAYLGARLPRQGEPSDTPEAIRRRVRRVLWLCFALYLHLILTFTLFDPGFGRNFLSILTATPEDRAYYLTWYVNLTPFETIRTIYINGFRNGYITERYLLLNLAGNLFAFAPFAFFLPQLWQKMDRFLKFLPLILAIVITVELCQLALMCGSCDVDDVLLNVSGAVALYWLLRLPPMRRLIAYISAD